MCVFAAQTRTAFITAGGNVIARLCSMDQVKLNFTPAGSSAAKTVFIVDNSKVFIDSQESGAMMLSVQNNTAVLSGVMESGLVTGLDSRTGTPLFEVNVTVTGPGMFIYVNYCIAVKFSFCFRENDITCH